MSEKPLQYQIPKSRDIGDLIAILRAKLPFSEPEECALTRTFFDSFDWRLYERGATLEFIVANSDAQLCLNTSHANTPGCVTLATSVVPRFTWELPKSPLRQQLEPILAMRALLPQVTVASLCRNLILTDNQQKTVLRLQVEEHTVHPPAEATILNLGRFLTVLPVKGYPKPHERIENLIATDLGLQASRVDLLSRALAALGRQPMDYSAKLDIELDPSMRADAATKIILRHLLGAIRVNEKGTRENIDSEFLHDFRVAIRRTRAALSQIKGVLPDAVIDEYKAKFAWLGQITSPTRDLDVYLLNFNDYKASLPVAIRNDLDPMYEFLRSQHQQAQKILAQRLSSPEYKSLIRDWSNFLEKPLADKSAEPNAMTSVLALADRRIWKVYRRVLQDGRAITPDTEAEVLHELRKTCKKLRYLMEFFQGLYPKKQIRGLIRILKDLQDNLGAIQDYEVQEYTLKQFSQTMMKEGRVPAETLLAMGILVQDLDRRRQQARAEFAERFAGFDSDDHRQGFKALFSSQAAKEQLH